MRLLLDPTPPVETGTASASAPDPTEGFKAALKKHGDDAAAFARETYRDLMDARNQLSALTAKIPKDGSVVLEGDDAAEWSQLRTFGKANELKAKLDEREALAARLAKRERDDLLTLAAKSHGFDPEVFATLAGPDLQVEIKDGKDRLGRDVKIAEVIHQVDGKEARTPLDKYAEKAFPKFLPSLRGDDTKSSPALKRSPVPTTTPNQDTGANGVRPVLKFGRF